MPGKTVTGGSVSDNDERSIRQGSDHLGNTTGAGASQYRETLCPWQPSHTDLASKFPAGTTYGSSGRSAASVAGPPAVSAPHPGQMPTTSPWPVSPQPTPPPADAPIWQPQTYTAAPTPSGSPQPTATPNYGIQQGGQQAPGAPGYGAAAPLPASQAAQWLAKPEHLKLVAAGTGGIIALFLLLSGNAGSRIAAVVIVMAIWAVCFRQGYHEKAGLRARTRISTDEATRAAADLANILRGPLSSVQFDGFSSGRADFTVRGATWQPLKFHVNLVSDPTGWTFVSTHLDNWTWNRYRVYFIPVPFTKSMDGYSLYRSFCGRLLTELQQRDGAATGAFNTRPQ
jgi:hypothetical protein